jgi:hypothetical protein
VYLKQLFQLLQVFSRTVPGIYHAQLQVFPHTIVLQVFSRDHTSHAVGDSQLVDLPVCVLKVIFSAGLAGLRYAGTIKK